MATTVKAKSPSITATVPVPATNVPHMLTVVVLDAESRPVSGASVSITPSDASAVTNAAGEAQFTLGTASKYEVTASNGNSTVTVPYYVTANGATRLVVNPVYVKAVEAERHPSPWYGSGVISTAGIILGIVVVVIVIWRFFRRRK
jgi:hypothetical protein